MYVSTAACRAEPCWPARHRADAGTMHRPHPPALQVPLSKVQVTSVVCGSLVAEYAVTYNMGVTAATVGSRGHLRGHGAQMMSPHMAAATRCMHASRFKRPATGVHRLPYPATRPSACDPAWHGTKEQDGLGGGGQGRAAEC
jgi:hypothetical protein